MKLKGYQYVILIFLLGFCFYNTYSIHFDYPFPYHHDEWQHTGIVVQIIDTGYNIKHNPYMDVPTWHTDLESGFHLFIANLFVLTGLDPIFYYQYLAAVFAVITGFVIFFLVYRLSKNYLSGLVSVLVFSVLRTNVNILGKNYFIPMSMAFTFIYSFVYLFQKALKEKKAKYFHLSLLTLFLLLLIHPPSFVILLVPFIIEVMLNLRAVKSFLKVRKLSILPVIIIFIVLFYLLAWKGKFYSTFEYFFDLLFFEPGWGKLEVTYFIPLLYGIVPTFLAFIGMVHGFNDLKYRFFVMFSFVSLAITTIFAHFGFTFLVPYGRAVHYSMISMIPLTAYGFQKVVESRALKNKDFMKFIFLILFVFILFSSKYNVDQYYKKYTRPVATEKEYVALKWIQFNYGEKNILVTPYFMTSAVYPVSKNQVISLIPAQLHGGNTSENLDFYIYNCETQKRIVNETKAEFILSRDMINCDFVKQIYYDTVWVYEIDMGE